MHGKTALARWIDTAALYMLALACAIWLMYSATGNVNVALTIGIISAALLAPAIRGISRAAKTRRSGRYSGELGGRLAMYLITKPPEAARAELDNWLGPEVISRGDTVFLPRHPEYPFTAQDALEIWQTRSGGSLPIELYVTADVLPSARELCQRLESPRLTVHSLRDIYTLARDKLPASVLEAPEPPSPRERAAKLYGTLVKRERAGRYAAYGLSLLLMGRLLALPYARVPGLICLVLWLLCAAEKPES